MKKHLSRNATIATCNWEFDIMLETIKQISFDIKFLIASLAIGLLAFSLYCYENIESYNTAKNGLNKAVAECLIQQKNEARLEARVFCDEEEFLRAEDEIAELSQSLRNFIAIKRIFNKEIANLATEKHLQYSVIWNSFILIMGYAFAIGIAPIFWKFLLKRITELVKAFKG